MTRNQIENNLTYHFDDFKASKLGLKRNKSIVSLFGLFQIVQFNHMPLITTLVADSDSNTGEIVCLFFIIFILQ